MDNNGSNLTLEQLMQSVAVPQENAPAGETVIDASAFHNQVQTPSVPVDSNFIEGSDNVSPKEVDITDIKPFEVKKVETIVDNEMDKLAKAMDREHDRIMATKAEAYDKLEELEEAKKYKEEASTVTQAAAPEEDTLGSIFNNTIATPVQPKVEYATPVDEPVKVVTPNKEFRAAINTTSKDFADELSDESDSDDYDASKAEEEKFNKIRKVVSEKIVPFENKFDLSTFQISQKAVSTNRLMNMVPQVETTADWMLYSSKKPITMRALSGSDIQKMDTTQNTSKTVLNAYKEIYNILWDHIVMEDKPDFESWLKTTRFSDDADLFFAAYMATFNSRHSIPYTCTEDGCEEVFMVDLTFKELVKFKDEEVEKEVDRIRKSEPSPITNEYKVNIIQVSDNYAIGLRTPSLYHVLFEPQVLDQDLIAKYYDMIGLMSYIDNIYFIDTDTNSLVPIDLKPDAKNASKTVAHRYREFYKILSALTSDQQALLEKKIADIDESSDAVKYILPEVTCPKCNSVIPESEVTPLTLLFMRHRVAKLSNF